MNFIPDTILRALCWTLLHSLWQGLIFAVVAGIIMVLTKKASSSLRYNLLCCGMILFLAVSGYTFYHQLQLADTATVAATPLDNLQPSTHLSNTQPVIGSPSTGSRASAGTHTGTHLLRDGIDTLVQYFNTHASLVVVTWFILFLARFVQVLSGLVYAQRVRHYQTSPAPADWQQRLAQLLDKLQISRPVSLLESALVKVPLVVGVLKPVILVPIGMLTHLSADQVESILLHELAHIRRRDYLFNLVQHLVDTLFFFNPALIWVSSLIRAERENCCDDIAIRETRSRRQLIEALVSFHEYRQSIRGYALGFTGKDGQVVKRVKRIVHKKNHSLNAGERVLLMSGLLVLSAAFVTINDSRPAAVQPKAAIQQKAALSVAVKTITTDNPSRKVPKPAVLPQRVMPRAKADTTKKDSAQLAKPVQSDPADITYLGFHHLTIDKLIELKEHGVTVEFIHSFKELGYPDLTLDQALTLMDHGVRVGFIKDLNLLGFTNISLEKATELVDHGVTVDYIKDCKKKFGNQLTLNDYKKLRDAGIDPNE